MEDETQEYDVVRFAFREERLAALRRVYWKLCRTDKLDFQPDTVASVQQRQKVRGGPSTPTFV